MTKIIVFVMGVMLLLPSLSFAKKEGVTKGPHPSKAAIEHANANARFKRGENVEAKKEALKEKAKKHKKHVHKRMEDKAKAASEKMKNEDEHDAAEAEAE